MLVHARNVGRLFSAVMDDSIRLDTLQAPGVGGVACLPLLTDREVEVEAGQRMYRSSLKRL